MLIFFNFLLSQVLEKPAGADDATEEIIENTMQNIGGEGEFDQNTAFENLDNIRKNPLNLNKINLEGLQSLGLLTDLQAANIISYREKTGQFFSIYELQAINGLDLDAVRKILPYVEVSDKLDDYHISILKMLREGKNELFLRWSRIIEAQKGFLPVANPLTTRYLGDANRFYVRYRKSYENHFSVGLTAEKDPGEEFFKGSNKQGFDYYSAHVCLNNYNATIKTLAVGDYVANLGQGLIIFQGFAPNKSAFVTAIKRSARPIKQYTALNENTFFRGAAATLGLSKNFDLVVFASSRKKDANLIVPRDSTYRFEGFTAFQTSGLHRTQAEIADKNSVTENAIGGSLKFKSDRGAIALNGLYLKYSQPFNRTIQPFNQFLFSGDNLLNVSTDYSYIYKNLYIFGETAMSGNGAVGTINGLLINLDRTIDFAFLHRNIPRNFQTVFGNAFTENTLPNNEQGTYFGIEISPTNSWKLSGYFDIWKNPWLTFSTDAPSGGYEYLAKITYLKKRKWDASVLLRYKSKDANFSDNISKTASIVTNSRTQLRFHLNNKITKQIELRSRLELVKFEQSNNSNITNNGFLLYQDILYKPINFPLSLTARFAIFDTKDYNSRIYAYENDILYSFSVPPYFNRGTRYYVNLRYNGVRHLTMELHYGLTYFANKTTFGSGLDEINKPQRSEIKAQIRYSF